MTVHCDEFGRIRLQCGAIFIPESHLKMSLYLQIKDLHIFLIALHALHLGTRWFWRWRQVTPSWPRFWRIAPHGVDSLLMASGLSLMVLSQQWPWHTPWLAAKLSLLLVYIGCGRMALRAGTSRSATLGWGLLSGGVLVLMVSLAHFRPTF